MKKLEEETTSYTTILSLIGLTNLYGTFKLIKDTSDNLIESNKVLFIFFQFFENMVRSHSLLCALLLLGILLLAFPTSTLLSAKK